MVPDVQSCKHEEGQLQLPPVKLECKKEEMRLAMFSQKIEVNSGGKFEEGMLDHITPIMKHFGGPRQYLDWRFKDNTNKNNFVANLERAFPKIPLATYHTESVAPSHMNEIMLHISDLGWEVWCSTKPPPFENVCLTLCDEILHDTFVTHNDPIKLSSRRCPEYKEEDGGIPFWACYIKGAARSATALMIADRIMVNNIDPALQCPELARSFSCIIAKLGSLADSEEAIAFENAKLSVRGSIRKAHDVVTWLGVFSLMKKKQHAFDASALVNKWNKDASKQSQIVGTKKVALLNLLTLEDEAVDFLIGVVSTHGDTHCFQEDAFANKKIMPGNGPLIRSSPLWTSRLKVSPASFMGMLKMCIANFVRRPVAIRKPLDKDGLEDCARQASLVWALASEMSMAVPVSPDKIQQCWFNVFQEGDMNIELTLQQAIAEKKIPLRGRMLLSFENCLNPICNKKGRLKHCNKHVVGIISGTWLAEMQLSP